jgi:hypothetical protein
MAPDQPSATATPPTAPAPGAPTAPAPGAADADAPPPHLRGARAADAPPPPLRGARAADAPPPPAPAHGPPPHLRGARAADAPPAPLRGARAADAPPPPAPVHGPPPPPAPAALPADAPPPRLADGVELVGEYRDSGFKEPPYIVRRADGQVIQLPKLLYRLVEQVDGRRDYDAVAEALSHAIGRGVTGDMVRMLADEKLRPLGVLAAADGSTPNLHKVDPLLALKFRTAVIPERVTRALTTIFKPLFAPPVVVAVVAGLFALDGWLLFAHGIAAPVRATLYRPALLLALLGCVVLATAFHEIGHATACRYGGARPGVMGVGIYLVWPAFYTDVTDAYRLGRRGRLRTDLGGVYFNAVFALAAGGAYFATGFEPVLLVVLVQNFAIVQQLLPLLRLDGYYIISDLTGVPDMLGRIKPVLASLIPRRPADSRVTALKPWVRVAVTAYICTIVPVIAASLVLMVAHAPRAFATAYDSAGVQVDRIRAAPGVAAGATDVVQLALLVLPCVGMVLTGGRIGGRICRSAWCWSEGEPLRRGALGVGALAAVALTAFVWWPNGEYRPIQPTERGTIQEAVRDLRALPTGRPALTQQRERELGGAPTERSRLHAGRAAESAAGGGGGPIGTDRSRPDRTSPDQTSPDQTSPDSTMPNPTTTAPGSTTSTPGTTVPAPGDATTSTGPIAPGQTPTTPTATPPGTMTVPPGAARPEPATPPAAPTTPGATTPPPPGTTTTAPPSGTTTPPPSGTTTTTPSGTATTPAPGTATTPSGATTTTTTTTTTSPVAPPTTTATTP